MLKTSADRDDTPARLPFLDNKRVRHHFRHCFVGAAESNAALMRLQAGSSVWVESAFAMQSENDPYWRIAVGEVFGQRTATT
jgi:hypothetical protein